MKPISAMFAGTIILSVRMAGAAAPVELLTAGDAPTANDCAVIANFNSEKLKSIVEKHGQCLRAHTASRASFREGDPCSQAECRPLHVQMGWVQGQNNIINKDCRSRVDAADKRRLDAKIKSNEEEAALRERQRLLLKADQLHEKGQKVVESAKLLDRPLDLLLTKMGERGKQEFERILFGEKSNRDTKEDLDWEVYSVFHDRTGQTMERLFDGKPVAGAINQEMREQLKVMFNDVKENLDRGLADMARIGHELPGPTGYANLTRRTYRAPSSSYTPIAPIPSGPTAQDGGGGCELLKDSNRSMALLNSDTAQWNALLARCSQGEAR